MTRPITSPVTGSADVRGRVLMIARDYPPTPMVAALRARGFARYLPEFGWSPSVVTVTAGFHAVADPSLRGPPDCPVYRAFAFDPKRAPWARGRYPRMLALPDRTVSWLPAGVVQGLRAIRRERVQALLSTSPPATAHAIGLVLKWLTKLPWIVDLRDPWPTGADGFAGSVNARLERRVINAADRITVTTPGLADDLRMRYGAAVSAKVHVVCNGYDEEDFLRLPPPNGAMTSFTIAHVGSIYARERHPGNFLAAVREGLDCGALPGNMTVAFVGSGEFADSGALGQLAQSLGLQEIVRVVDAISHDDALSMMLRVSTLLLLQNGEDVRACIPAKTFEYLRSGRHILALAPADSETRRLLSDFTGIFAAAPDDRRAIAEQLSAAYQAWGREPCVPRHARDLCRYTRRASAAGLAHVLSELCA